MQSALWAGPQHHDTHALNLTASPLPEMGSRENGGQLPHVRPSAVLPGLSVPTCTMEACQFSLMGSAMRVSSCVPPACCGESSLCPADSSFLCFLLHSGMFIGLSGWVQKIGSLSGRGCPALRTEGMRELARPGAAGGQSYPGAASFLSTGGWRPV